MSDGSEANAGAKGDEQRVAHDSLGDVEVPAGVRWGAQTQRAVQNFPISGCRMPQELIRAVALVKAAAAEVNGRLGRLDVVLAGEIRDAALEIAAGECADQFPIDVYQTGSGTSTNMNVNEVIASLVSERVGSPVHPNDDVNASQSSNDVIPTAIRLAVIAAVAEQLLPALDLVVEQLEGLAARHARDVGPGRTHLMDAAPLFVGDQFGAHAATFRADRRRIEASLDELRTPPLGGTAVGTGLGAPAGWREAVVAQLSEVSGIRLSVPDDAFAAQRGLEPFAVVSAALRTLAASLLNLADELRQLSSGPVSGLGQIELPALQPGSSIMPGKVNPVIPEAVMQVALRVIGNDTVVATAAGRGSFELNVHLPVVGDALLESVHLAANVGRLLAERCLAGVRVDVDHARDMAARSPVNVTAVATRLGYDRAAEIVKEANRTGADFVDLVVEAGLERAEAEELLDPSRIAMGERLSREQ